MLLLINFTQMFQLHCTWFSRGVLFEDTLISKQFVAILLPLGRYHWVILFFTFFRILLHLVHHYLIFSSLSELLESILYNSEWIDREPSISIVINHWDGILAREVIVALEHWLPSILLKVHHACLLFGNGLRLHLVLLTLLVILRDSYNDHLQVVVLVEKEVSCLDLIVHDSEEKPQCDLRLGVFVFKGLSWHSFKVVL